MDREFDREDEEPEAGGHNGHQHAVQPSRFHGDAGEQHRHDDRTDGRERDEGRDGCGDDAKEEPASQAETDEPVREAAERRRPSRPSPNRPSSRIPRPCANSTFRSFARLVHDREGH